MRSLMASVLGWWPGPNEEILNLRALLIGLTQQADSRRSRLTELAILCDSSLKIP